jgi:chemotaxis protein methyltransferase CheR
MQTEGVADVLWARVSTLIADTIGLNFPPERRQDLQRGLASAAIEFGFEDAAACADWLLSVALTRKQLHTLAGHLTVGETYFFRERNTFDALRQQILPEILRQRRGREQRLRLWSAACSTGEEPYSLAILLRQLLPDWQDWRVTILATDINERFLKKAAAGVYGEWSFRESPTGFKETFFTRTADGRFAIASEIRQQVTFVPLNLAQDVFPSLATDTNAMDLIFCRNVLMYFTPAQMRKLVDNLRYALTDGGWLAVSPSECSKDLFTQFVSVSFPGTTFYRKSRIEERVGITRPTTLAGTVAQCAAPSGDPISARAPSDIATPSIQYNSTGGSGPNAEANAQPQQPAAVAQALYQQGQYAEAAAMLTLLVEEAGLDAEHSAEALIVTTSVFSLLARSLANEGRLTDARTWGERWIAADKLNARAHYLHATVLQELGERELARGSLQRAVYLQPDFSLAHFALGNLARAGGFASQATRHFRNALRLLHTRPADEVLPESDGLTAARLGEIIATLLDLPQRPFVSRGDSSDGEHGR